MGNDYELSDMIRDVPWYAESECSITASLLCVGSVCAEELKNRGVTIDDKRKVWRPYRRLPILTACKDEPTSRLAVLAKTWSCADGRSGAGAELGFAHRHCQIHQPSKK